MLDEKIRSAKKTRLIDLVLAELSAVEVCRHHGEMSGIEKSDSTSSVRLGNKNN